MPQEGRKKCPELPKISATGAKKREVFERRDSQSSLSFEKAEMNEHLKKELKMISVNSVKDRIEKLNRAAVGAAQDGQRGKVGRLLTAAFLPVLHRLNVTGRCENGIKQTEVALQRADATRKYGLGAERGGVRMSRLPRWLRTGRGCGVKRLSSRILQVGSSFPFFRTTIAGAAIKTITRSPVSDLVS